MTLLCFHKSTGTIWYRLNFKTQASVLIQVHTKIPNSMCCDYILHQVLLWLTFESMTFNTKHMQLSVLICFKFEVIGI